jgi:hypothetical protein
MVGGERKEAEESRTSPSGEMYRDRNKQILTLFSQLCPGKGPREAPGRPVMQISTGHADVRFEWAQRGKKDKVIEVAVQFLGSSKEQNQALYRLFKEHEAQLNQAIQSKPDMNETFTFKEDWGEKWASVYLQNLAEPWSEEIARWAADRMNRLIPVAQPLIDQFYEDRDKASIPSSP